MGFSRRTSMVAAFEASGLTVGAFAARHGVGTHRVWYWRSKLAKKAGAGARGRGFVAVRVDGRPTDREAREGRERWVAVQLRNGRRLELRGAWDEASICAWVSALEGAA